MANFEPAFDYMIKNEDYNLVGKVTTEPNGGKARFGINSVFHPEAIHDGFYEMPTDQALDYAKKIFERDYWDGRGFDKIGSQQLATKLFDMAVNMGNGGEVGVLQEALEVPITHKLDARTSFALLGVDKEFIGKLVVSLKKHYQEIYDANPNKYKNVLNGWMGRADKLPPADE